MNSRRKNLTKRQIASAFQGGDRLARELSREELGVGKRDGKKWYDVDDSARPRARSSRRLFLVSYYSPMRGRRVEFVRPIEARSIADAKQHGRALVTNELKPKDFVAREVRQNSAKKKSTACTKCGGAHHALYCNAQGGAHKNGERGFQIVAGRDQDVGSVYATKAQARAAMKRFRKQYPAEVKGARILPVNRKENLFGIGGSEKRAKRLRKHARVASAKATVIEAKQSLRRARKGNPGSLRAKTWSNAGRHFWMVYRDQKGTRGFIFGQGEAEDAAPARLMAQTMLRDLRKTQKQNPKTPNSELRTQNPLRPGKSRAIVSANIRQLVNEGKPQKQAIAIALRAAGLARQQNPAFIDAILQGAGFSVGAGAVAATGLAALTTSAGKKLRRAIMHNPTRANVTAALKLCRKENPPEWLSTIATSLGVAVHAHELHKRLTGHGAKSHRRPNVRTAARRMAQRRHGHVAGHTRTIHRAVKNSDWKTLPLDEIDFSIWIQPLSEKESKGKWDWLVTVTRKTDGKFKRDYVSGGRVVAESVAQKLRRQLGYGTIPKTRKSAKRPNPATESLRKIHKEFLGRDVDGRMQQVYAPARTPDDVVQIGQLRRIVLGNGYQQRFPRDGAFMMAAPPTAAQLRNGAHVVHDASIYFGLVEPMQMPAALRNGKPINRGAIKMIEYEALKEHLYGKGSPVYLFFHHLGEEGGAQPELIVQNGCIMPIKGDYEIKREGIRD